MLTRFTNLVCWLSLVLLFVPAGCRQGQRPQEQQETYDPFSDPNFVLSDDASQLLDPAGGRKAWMRTKKLQLDCVVTFCLPDGSSYITEQHHEIHPWSNLIRVTTDEPRGKFVWLLSERGFEVFEGAERVGALPVNVCERYFADAVLNMITAPARLGDSRIRLSKASRPVRIEGRYYYPIKRQQGRSVGPLPYWSKSVFFQNSNTSLVDMIWLADVDGQTFYAVRGYDYVEIEKGGILVPTKVEVFQVVGEGVLGQRLVRIDYHALKTAR